MKTTDCKRCEIEANNEQVKQAPRHTCGKDGPNEPVESTFKSNVPSSPPQTDKTMKTGIELIAQERKEQIEKHGRTIQGDVNGNNSGELRKGAIALICGHGDGDISELPNKWSDDVCLKMIRKGYKERLIIAGALIAAEIDRLNNI